MEEYIKILEEIVETYRSCSVNEEGFDMKVDIGFMKKECEALENLIARYKQLEEENKNMKEEYLVNNPGMAKYLNDNYIFKSKIESKIKVLETLQKEFPNNEELRIKIIAYKELLGR